MSLAIGIVAFGLVSMVGLLPAGLQVFRQAMDLTLETQMVQHIVADAGQLEFNRLTELESRDYFFDDTGSLVDASNPLKLYSGNVEIEMNSHLPGAASGNLALLTITFTRAGATGAQATQGKFVTYIADRAGSGSSTVN